MDWLTFVSTNIKSLAWPGVVLIALLVLRRQLGDLLHTLGTRLQTAKGGGLEFVFGEAVDQIETSLGGEVKEPAVQIENISQLSQLPPPYVVSQAWLKLEQAIRDTVDTSATDITARTRKPPLSPWEYVELATRQELLSKDELAAIQQLRHLRNQAAHSVDPGITSTDALRYQDIANSLIEKIKERARQRPRPEQ
jgi:hypothetical protein